MPFTGERKSEYNYHYYRANKDKYRAARQKYYKDKRYRVWHNGEWIYTNRRHPFSKEIKSMQHMREVFVLDESKICWWCGQRPIPCLKKEVEVDHVASMCYICPRAVVCKHCNTLKRNVLPNTDQLQRLLYDKNVLRDVSAEHMKQWCEAQSKEIFGNYAGGISLLLTKIVGQEVRRKSSKGKFMICKSSNDLCERLGIP